MAFSHIILMETPSIIGQLMNSIVEDFFVLQ